MSPDRHSYVPAFDGLRGIAILPVILLHVGVDTLPNGSLLFQLSRGWYGVDLFFVLSGFLITRILVTEMDATGTIDLPRFYGRRFLRLTPAYVSMLTTVLIGAVIFAPPELQQVPKVLPALVTYTYNYQIAAGAAQIGVLTVIWSLCVEEQFYLVWPWILRRLGARRALWFCLAAVAALSVYRIALYALLNLGHMTDPTPKSAIWIYFATDTRIGVIFVGCAAALSLRERVARRFWASMRESRHLPTLAAVAACLAAAFVTGAYPSSASWRSATFGYTLASFTTAALIGAVFVRPSSGAARALAWRPLVSLGKISYGAYLFHPAIAWLLLRIDAFGSVRGRASRFMVASLAVMAITWIVAALHYEYVEKWFLARRKPTAGRVDSAAEATRLARVAAN